MFTPNSYSISGDQPPGASPIVAGKGYDAVYCYADYVQKNNMPHGLFRLRQSECARREYHYQFYYKNNRLQKVLRCNSFNKPYPIKVPWQEDRPMLLEIVYNHEGKPAYHLYKNENERESLKIAFNGDRFIDFQSIDGKHIRTYTHLFRGPHSDSETFCYNAVTSLAIVRDARGYIRELRFHNTEHKPIQNEHGAWGLRYERDDRGRILSSCYISQDGEPVEDANGVASREFRYGKTRLDAAFIVRVSWRDKRGKLAKGRSIWASMVLTWNHHGNLEGQYFYDSNLARCLNMSNTSRVDWVYDEHGQPIRKSFADINDKLCKDKNGDFIIESGHNESGECTERRFYDIHGNPCKNAEGYHKIIWTRSEHQGKRLLDIAYYDEQNVPCSNKNKHSRARITYDARGNPSVYAVFNEQGIPCLCKEQYASFKVVPDDTGNITELQTFDTKGKRCTCSDNFSRVVIKRDSRGNPIEVAYYDEEDKPCASREGYAVIRLCLDEHGRHTQRIYTDAYNNPAADRDGIYKTTWAYDASGKLLHKKSYDVKGQLVTAPAETSEASQESTHDE